MNLDVIRSFIRTEILEDQSAVLAEDEDLLLSEVFDSLSVTRLVEFLETEMGIEIPPEDVTLENFQTLGHIARYLESRTAVPRA